MRASLSLGLLRAVWREGILQPSAESMRLAVLRSCQVRLCWTRRYLEDFTTCAARETMEETGLSVKNVRCVRSMVSRTIRLSSLFSSSCLLCCTRSKEDLSLASIRVRASRFGTINNARDASVGPFCFEICWCVSGAEDLVVLWSVYRLTTITSQFSWCARLSMTGRIH